VNSKFYKQPHLDANLTAPNPEVNY